MADMSVSVTFNLPEYHIAEAQQLLAMVGDMVQVECLLAGTEQDEGRKGQVRKGKQRQS